MIPQVAISNNVLTVSQLNNNCQKSSISLENKPTQDVFIKQNNTNPIIKIGYLPKDKIEKIINIIELQEKNPDKSYPDIEKIGKGRFGCCYKIKFTDPDNSSFSLVVKKQLNKDEKDSIDTKPSEIFLREAQVLNYLSKSVLKNIPKFVTFFEKADINYIVETFMEGKEIDFPKNPLTKEHLKILLNTFAVLDKNSIIHDDFHFSNILITPENVNIIDFGRAKKFTPDNLYRIFDYDSFLNTRKDLIRKSFNPYFPILVNTDSFEVRGLYSNLNSCFFRKDNSEIRQVFTDYLKLKSDYHCNTVEILENIKNKELDKIDKKVTIPPEKIKEMLDKAIEYEKLQAKLLKNPSDEIIDIEADKIQLKYNAILEETEEKDKDKLKYFRCCKIIYFLRLKEKIDSLIEKTSPDSDEGKYYRNVREVLNNFSQFMDFDKISKNWDIHDPRFDLYAFDVARAISEGKLAEKDQTYLKTAKQSAKTVPV